MSALSDFKAAMRPGVEIDVTNHYITRPDHSSFGTTRRQIDKTNSASFYTSANPWPVAWPKASMVTHGTDGAWHLDYPGQPGVPFLTIKLVQS